MPTVRDKYAQHILNEYHGGFDEIPKVRHLPVSFVDPVKIGIVGAGVAGLYTALMLDWLGDQRFQYDLLEANPNPDRKGGRLYTHKFSNDTFDYYDVGAMRFPQLDWMQPTFDLMKYVGITKENGSLIKYIMSTENNILFYNGVTLTKGDVKKGYQEKQFDPFKTKIASLDNQPDVLINGKIGLFKDELVKNWQTGWDLLMGFDKLSTRIFMAFDPGLPNLSDSAISYLETLDSSTGLYDCALSESVLDSLDFDYPDPNGGDTDWYCIVGGAETMACKAISMIKQPFQHGKRVTAISPAKSEDDRTITGVNITINGTEQATYDHVISTMPLSCLNVVDISKCALDWETTTAIRQLHYDGSVKVAIKFKYRWWQDPNVTIPQIGGVSSTDRPTRTIVYPSYGTAEPDAPGTMIVSYTWAQDSFRFGSLLTKGNGEAPQHLLDIILRDLTDIHGIKTSNADPDYTFLPNQLVRTDTGTAAHAWDWYADENSMGAFALFGPGQFTQLYPKLTQPAFGRLHFAGEATSVHHAWVVGALNSAYRSLTQVFRSYKCQELIDKLHDPDSPFKNAGKYEFQSNQLKNQLALGQLHGEWLTKGGDDSS